MTLTDSLLERGIGEIIALSCLTTFGLMTFVLLALGNAPANAWRIEMLPIGACALAVATEKRPIIWISLGLCLAYGVTGLPGFGFGPFLTGICLFAWWCTAARRKGVRIVRGEDLVWELAGFMPFIIAMEMTV
jgi:hypothetical protein